MSDLNLKTLAQFDFSENVNAIFSEITHENIEKLSHKYPLLVQTSVDGTIEYANVYYKDHFGRGEHSIIGKKVSDFDHPSCFS